MAGSGGAAGSAGRGGSGGTAGSAGGIAGGAGSMAGSGGGVAGGPAGAGGGGTGGGMAGAGGSAPGCYTVAFTAPTNGATLTVANDKTNTCGDGFQIDVAITTNAPAGTDVNLFAGNTLLRTVQTTGSGATFANVQVASTGQTELAIQFPSTTACADPSTKATVTVNCPSTAPTCNITAPTIDGTHLALNGVPAPAGDRTSSIGSMYQATFIVTTNIEDGRPVVLSIANAATPTVVTPVNAVANGGTATVGVQLSPDATYEVVATCTNSGNVSGTSAKATYPVNTIAPDLTVSQPAAGQFLVGSTFSVCGQTPSTDAAGLPASLGQKVNNLCVALSSSGGCVASVPVTAVGVDACATITCPGGAPFDLFVTLTDLAGNPTTKTISGVSCASALPSVQIITPVSDAPAFGTLSRRILSATAPAGVHDTQPALPGAQANVVACTDRAGTAALTAGHVGDATLTTLASGTVAAAVTADNCPSGLGFAIHFDNVTLPESVMTANGDLTTASRLQVKLTETANPASIGSSAFTDVWVDTTPPSLSLASPAGLCGSFTQAPTTVTQAVAFNAETTNVAVEVVNGASTTTYDTPSVSGGVATFSAVVFSQGQNDLRAVETDPAGNTTALVPDPCSVTIGSAPVVTFTSPPANAVLCPAGTPATCPFPDTGGAPGWQGGLTVHVTGGGIDVANSVVTFTVGTTTLGTATTNASGIATLAGASLAEGAQTITATTDNVPSRGVGSGTVNVTVDLTAPAAGTNLHASITNRRATTMQLTWTAPADAGGGKAKSYEIRYAKQAVNDGNFDTAVTTSVPYGATTVPADPGQLDGVVVSGLYIENCYYFGVKATDAAGNRGTLLASSSTGACDCDMDNACAAHFIPTVIPSTSGTTEQLGYVLDGSGDVNKDGKSDVIAGTFAGSRAYLYLGNGPTFTPAAPTVFKGTSPGFGIAVAAIGDIDKDTFEDLAISDFDPLNVNSAGKIYIYKGRASWPGTLMDTDANYVITPDSTYVNTNFGVSLARLGDFTGDGVDDFAIGVSAYASRRGRVIIVPGKLGGIGDAMGKIMLPDTANTITIDGDPTVTRGIFGYKVLGLGRFYTATTGNTLVVAAPGTSNGTNPSNEGRVYAFHPQAGSGGAIALSTADATMVGPGKPARVGIILTNLGGTLPAVGIGNPFDAISVPGKTGTFFVMSGTSGNDAAGPFVNKVVGTGVSGVGQVVFGGSTSGRTQSLSVIGNDGIPDVGVMSVSSTNIAIVDGATLSGSTVDMTTQAQVLVPLPVGWGNTSEAAGALVPDVNGDSIPDFAVSNGFTVVPGSVVVYW